MLTASFISQEKLRLGFCKSSAPIIIPSKLCIPLSLQPLVGFGGYQAINTENFLHSPSADAFLGWLLNNR